MVKSGSSSSESSMGSVAPFLKKCYEMVDDESTDDIISWNDTNDCFVVRDMTQFTVRLLPMYFKHSNFSSFMRQLNIYGFRKVDTDSWVFAHDSFLRGQKHLLKTISRRKHAQTREQRRAPEQKENFPDEPADNEELTELRKAVETLKIDKNTLSQELVKLRQHHESSETKLLGLRERLQGMEKSQQQMLSFLVMAMQYPGYFVKVVQPKENGWRVAEAVEEDPEDDKNAAASDGAIVVRYQSPPAVEASLASEKLPGSEDIFSDPEFMKFLVDDKIFTLESPGHFGIPDWIDDGSWEQLLLSSPFRESIEGTKVDDDDEETYCTEMDLELASLGTALGKYQNFGAESTVHKADTDKSRNPDN